MLGKVKFATVLLAGCCFTPLAAAAEEVSLIVERDTRSYDDMLDARAIRALVVRSKTGYSFDGAQQRGTT